MKLQMLTSFKNKLVKYARKRQQIYVVKIDVLTNKMIGELLLVSNLLSVPFKVYNMDDAWKLSISEGLNRGKIKNGLTDLYVGWMNERLLAIKSSVSSISFSLVEQNDRVGVTTERVFESHLDEIIDELDRNTSGMLYCIKETSKQGEDLIKLPNGEMALNILADINDSAILVRSLSKNGRSKLISVIFSNGTFMIAVIAFTASFPLFYIFNLYSATGAITPADIANQAGAEWAGLQSRIVESSSYIDKIKIAINAIWNTTSFFSIVCFFLAFSIKIARGVLNPDYSGHVFLMNYENKLYELGERISGKKGPFITVKVRLGDRFSNISGSKIVNRSSSVSV